MSYEIQPLAAPPGTPEQNHVAAASSERKEGGEETITTWQKNTPEAEVKLLMSKPSYEKVPSVPASSKDACPSARNMHGAAAVKTLTMSAVEETFPTRLETDTLTVKENIYLGQDKLEDELPNLQKPDEKVLCDTKELVSPSMIDAEDTANGVAELEAARELVQRVLETARSMVTRQGTATDCTPGKVTDGSVEAVPADLVVSVEGTEGAAVQQQLDHQGYFIQLSCLPTHLHQKAYQCFLAKVRQIKMVLQEAFSQLQDFIELIDYVKQGIDQKLQNGQEKLQQIWMMWNKKQPKASEDTASLDLKQLEAQILAMSYDITQQPQHIVQTLLANIQGFPSSIQDKILQVQQELQETHNFFQAAASFQDLTRNILTQKHYLMNTAQEYMDELLEYVEHNIPLAWLVGPFTPSRASLESQDSAKEKEDEENKSRNTQSCGSQLV